MRFDDFIRLQLKMYDIFIIIYLLSMIILALGIEMI